MLTKDIIKKLAPTSKDEIITPLVEYLNKHMPKYDVDNYLRVCHFLAQAAHEAAAFRTLEEYASGEAYEGRKDLGNTRKGDGVRYKGRGIFQLTGRANYRDIGKKIGMDLENNPELAESPEVSVLTALEYWRSRNLNPLADKDDVEGITRKINGGLNGFEDRKKYLSKIKGILPKDFSFETEKNVLPIEEVVVSEVQEELPPDPINPIVPPIVVARKGESSFYIIDLQKMLNRKGANLFIDGIFGSKTEQAVKDFQAKYGLKVTGEIDTDTLNKLMV
jgi:putative chitinase